MLSNVQLLPGASESQDARTGGHIATACRRVNRGRRLFDRRLGSIHERFRVRPRFYWSGLGAGWPAAPAASPPLRVSQVAQLAVEDLTGALQFGFELGPGELHPNAAKLARTGEVRRALHPLNRELQLRFEMLSKPLHHPAEFAACALVRL